MGWYADKSIDTVLFDFDKGALNVSAPAVAIFVSIWDCVYPVAVVKTVLPPLVIDPVAAKLPLTTVQIFCSAKLLTSRGVSVVEGLVSVRVLAVAAPAWFMDALSVPPL